MVSRLASLGYKLGVAGAILGLLVGCTQCFFGDDIPEWTGNKLHPLQLGIITIALSLASLICGNYLNSHRDGLTRERVLAGLLSLATAGICFTTVGRLWYVPGPLLLASSALLLRR
jgi:hypothetical protein